VNHLSFLSFQGWKDSDCLTTASASPAAGLAGKGWLINRAVGSRVQAVVGRYLRFFKIYRVRYPIAKKFSFDKTN
jgi:hypothetical protein